jgi:hypothetical protein
MTIATRQQNERMKVYVSPGNTKLGKVLNVSLPPIITCRCNAPCRNKDCYALKAWRQYPGTRAAWRGNLEAYQRNADDYFDALVVAFKRSKTRLVRYHVGGDVPDETYLAGMLRVARELPKKQFLTFTKQYELLESLKKIHVPANLNIIASAWPGLEMPAGLVEKFSTAWLRDPNKPDPRIPADARACPGNCASCGVCFGLKAGQSVVFDKH